MGNFLNTPKPLIRECEFFAKWTTDDLRILRSNFNKNVMGFSMIKKQFELVMEFKESELETSIDKLFDVLDNDNDGRVDALEFIGGVALCCRGTFEEKSKFAFELYDFNLNAALSSTEMCMMMQSSVLGMLVLTGGTEDMEPDVSVFEELAFQALMISDSDGSGQITYDEFVEWARSNVKVMSLIETLSKISANVTTSVEEEDVAEEEENEDLAAILCGEGNVSNISNLQESVNCDQPAHTKRIIDEMEMADNDDISEALKQMLNADSKDLPNYENSDEAPPSYLQLEWVHGYTSTDARQNLEYLKSSSDTETSLRKFGPNRFVYPAANTGIVYNKKLLQQSFYQGHTNEILSLKVHPGGILVATGQKGIKAEVHVWNSKTLECEGEWIGWS